MTEKKYSFVNNSRPEMIIFDYGNTLLNEPDSDFLRGEQALFGYIKSNKNNLTSEYVNAFAQRLIEETGRVRKQGFEIHERQFQRLVYEYLEIELSISYEEAERVFWDGVTPGAVMPGAGKMIDYINSRGIRSGVISNIMFSGKALSERLNRLLSNNRFEFVIASSEYALRKPGPMLFALALKKAGLEAEKVWFCGDNPQADVAGAAQVGIFPVWYDNDTECDYRDRAKETPPVCRHLYIKEWDEMIEILEGLK